MQINAPGVFVPPQPSNLPDSQVEVTPPNRLVVLECDQIALVFVVGTDAALSLDWYRQLSAYVQQHLKSLPPLPRSVPGAVAVGGATAGGDDVDPLSLYGSGGGGGGGAEAVGVLSSSSAGVSGPTSAIDEHYRYLYYNHFNFAVKTSFGTRAQLPPRDIMRVMSELHADMASPTSHPLRASEVIVRTANDGTDRGGGRDWVVRCKM